LRDLRVGLDRLETEAEALREAGWLRVTVPLSERDPDLNRKVRRLLPNALVVRAELPQTGSELDSRPERSAPPREHYRAFHRREHHSEPEIELVGAFDELYALAAADS
jgi:hypothetical protein